MYNIAKFNSWLIKYIVLFIMISINIFVLQSIKYENLKLMKHVFKIAARAVQSIWRPRGSHPQSVSEDEPRDSTTPNRSRPRVYLRLCHTSAGWRRRPRCPNMSPPPNLLIRGGASRFEKEHASQSVFIQRTGRCVAVWCEWQRVHTIGQYEPSLAAFVKRKKNIHGS